MIPTVTGTCKRCSWEGTIPLWTLQEGVCPGCKQLLTDPKPPVGYQVVWVESQIDQCDIKFWEELPNGEEPGAVRIFVPNKTD